MLWAMISMVAAQEVQLSIDTEQIIVGIPTILTVVATGFEEEPTPEVGDFAVQGKHRDAVRLSFLGVEPMVSRQTSIINGRRSDNVIVRYAYRYRMVVDKEGRFQVPSIQVKQGNVSATSSPGTFQVVEAPTTPEMAISMDLPSETLWVGQTVPLNLDLYLQRDIGDLSLVVPLFDEFPVYPAEVEGNPQLHTISTVHGDVALPIVQDSVERDGKGYTRVRLQAETTLTRAGNVTVQPARIVANMVVGQRRGFMGFSQNRYQLFQAKDTIKTLDVRPLPLTDQPGSFSGAVGESFSIRALANKTVVAVGEPIPIEIEVRGKGNLDGLKLPDFVELGFDPKHVETPSQAPLGLDNDEGGKIFSFSIRLKDATVRNIPALEFAYFDPVAGRYQHAYTQPIALSVSGSDVVSSTQVITATPSESANTDGVSIGQSLSTTEFDLSWDGSMGVGVNASKWWLWTMLIHAGAIVMAGVLRWREQNQDVRVAKRAQRNSERALQRALKRAKSEPAAEVSSDLNLALKDFGAESGVDVSGVISAVEIESYHPNARSTSLSSGVLETIRALLPLLLMLLGLWFSPSASAEPDFQAAYQAALSQPAGEAQRQAMTKLQVQLKSSLAQQPEDGVLWANLGTVSVQIPDRGQAVYAYQQAVKLGYATPQVLQNQQALQRSLPSWAQAPSSSGVLTALRGVPSVVLWGVFNAAVVVVVLLWRRQRRVAYLFGVVWLVLGAVHGTEWLSGRQATMVVMETTPLRSADNLQAPLVQNEWLPAGATVQVQQVQGDWIQVRLQGENKIGWILTKG